MKRFIPICIGLVLLLGAPLAARAGSIGLQASGAEDGMTNDLCTGSGAPASCCTGSGTGTCGDENVFCTSSGTPLGCCTGSGTGTCATITNASRLTRSGAYDRLTVASMPTASADACSVWHFPMPPDYSAAGAMSYYLNLIKRGASTDTTNAASFHLDMACLDDLESSDPIVWALGSICSFVPSVTTSGLYKQLSCTSSTNVTEAACSPSDHVAVRLCRYGPDTNTMDWDFVDLNLQY